MRRIQVLTHPGQTLSEGYLIHALARHWREDRIEAVIGPARKVVEELAILHVDLTHVPSRCLPANPRSRPLLNGNVLDISKRRVSVNLLSPRSNWPGPVIVKTNANSGGAQERKLWSPMRRKAIRGFRRLTRFQPIRGYPIYAALQDVPDRIWKRRDIVVERFVPEMENGQFSLRMWIFFGDQGYYERRFGSHPHVKVRTTVRTAYLDEEVPQSIRDIRARMGLDFGKIDFVIHEGEAITLDVNKTPTVAYDPASDRQRRLAGGLFSFIPR